MTPENDKHQGPPKRGGGYWRPFEDAREFARSLGINSRAEWKEYGKSGNKPEDIPKAPYAIYEDQWRGWRDWLGTEGKPRSGPQRVWRPFEDARKFVRSLDIKSKAEWDEYIRSTDGPDDIPKSPHALSVYKDQWRGYGDWLGTGRLHRAAALRPFGDVKKFARSLSIKTKGEWEEYSKSGHKPYDIPAQPQHMYKEEWRGWPDFLGKERFRSFEAGREFARSLGLLSSREWVKYSQSGDKPEDIPAHPDGIYEDQWRGYGDWLGISGTIWTRRALLAFLEDLRPRLGDLEETELYLILQQGGAMPGLRKALGGTSALGVLKDLQENDARGVEDALREVADTEILEAETNGVDTLEVHTPEDSDLTEDLLEGAG